MAATPLTDARWRGLPLLACHMDPGRYHLRMQVPRLIIRKDIGTDVEVFGNAGRRVAFRQAPLRFDLFVPGLDVSAVSDRVDTTSLVVALPQTWMDDATAGERLPLSPRFQFGDPPLRRLVWRLAHCHELGMPLGEDYARALSQAIVDRVVALQTAWQADSPGLHPEARRLVAALIDDALPDTPTVARLAAAVGMNAARFAREFRATFQMAPARYIRLRRLQRAQDLLRSTDAPLISIALDLGFASQAHFSSSFHAVIGMTPSDFRRQAGTGNAPVVAPAPALPV